jgi:hypothetical protein
MIRRTATVDLGNVLRAMGEAHNRLNIVVLSGGKFLARHAILLADANGPQTPGAHIGAHRSHMKPEARGDLVKSVHMGFFTHRYKMPQTYLSVYI